LLLNFFTAAKALREQHTDVPPLYSFTQTDNPDIPKMAIRHVVDIHMKRFLLEETTARNIRTTAGPSYSVTYIGYENQGKR